MESQSSLRVWLLVGQQCSKRWLHMQEMWVAQTGLRELLSNNNSNKKEDRMLQGWVNNWGRSGRGYEGEVEHEYHQNTLYEILTELIKRIKRKK